MRNLYARIVLWLIRPALEFRSRTSIQFHLDTTAANSFRKSQKQIARELGKAAQSAFRRS